MADDCSRLVVLARVATELEASAIVGELDARGIRGKAVGGYTASFRAEAPGDVAVVVAAADLGRAKQILNELRESPAEIDWSQVDVGDAE